LRAIVIASSPQFLGGAHDKLEAHQMPDNSHQLPPRYLRTPEAARFLGLSGRTLEKHRTFGTGPVYRKLGGRIVYALGDLQAWANRGLRQSTSDTGGDVVHPARPQPGRPKGGA
jgi:predicted DNA-binding transcriptional regulator AlpA